MRYSLVFFIILFCCRVQAQEPKVTVSLSDQQPLVGQVTTVKVKVLVPTWFSKPLYFDEVEAINIINIKGNKSTYPTSETIKGQTWTGVIKEYPVIAMAQGKFELQLPTLNIHFMSDDNKPIERAITPQSVTFNATIPKAAATLSPVIIAEKISLKEQLKQPESLTTGQSIQRTISAKITTSSALFIPQLLPTTNTEQAQAYPATTSTTDNLNDRTSELTGTRIEQQDILIKQDGQLALSAINIRYYQPSTDSIQTASIEGKTLVIKPPDMTIKAIIWFIVIAVIVLAAMLCLYKVAKQTWKRYQQSESAHFKRLINSSNQDPKGYYQNYMRWYMVCKSQINQQASLTKLHQDIVISFEQAVYTKVNLPNDLPSQLANFRQAIEHCNKIKTEQLQQLNP